jgi:hypothetical protein
MANVPALEACLLRDLYGLEFSVESQYVVKVKFIERNWQATTQKYEATGGARVRPLETPSFSSIFVFGLKLIKK